MSLNVKNKNLVEQNLLKQERDDKVKILSLTRVVRNRLVMENLTSLMNYFCDLKLDLIFVCLEFGQKIG